MDISDNERPRAGSGCPEIDRLIHRFAARQHGVVSRAQLLAAGAPAHRIDYRLRTERLEIIHRCIYRSGPVEGRRAKEMAAVLACGAAAVVSHRSASAVWLLTPPRRTNAPVDVSVPGSRHGPREGVRLHRVRPMKEDEVMHKEGLPITTPVRTLLDIAGVVGKGELERALARADREGLADFRSIDQILSRYPRRRGTRQLRRLIGSDSPALTRSEAEERLLELIRRARLRQPRTNANVSGHEVDFVWHAERLVVEVDGFAFHSSRSAFESDRRRDADLAAAGFRVMRVTWRQLSSEPEAILVRVAQALGRE